MTPVEKSIALLREDAIERGFQELAITYGWSAIRLSGERLNALIQSMAGDESKRS